MQRLAPKQSNLSTTTSHVALMAKSGFRTLLIAQRDISESEFAQWNVDFHNASVSLDNREDKVATVADRIEKRLILCGATAVEDKLQVTRGFVLPEIQEKLLETAGTQLLSNIFLLVNCLALNVNFSHHDV